MLEQKEKAKKDFFQFKQFSLAQENCSMKVGTDGILLGAWADVRNVETILDIGTGTGLIALMLAQRSSAEIHAVEVDEAAWKQASENIDSSPWKDRVKAHHDAIQDFSKLSRLSFDLVVSNPPFFSGGVFSENKAKNDVRHTIKLPNGDLLNAARNLMSKEGRFCVILPVLEGLRFKEMAKNYGLYCTKTLEVFPTPDKKANRLLMQFEKEEKDVEENQHIIWESQDVYTQEQINLTKDFYLKM